MSVADELLDGSCPLQQTLGVHQRFSQLRLLLKLHDQVTDPPLIWLRLGRSPGIMRSGRSVACAQGHAQAASNHAFTFASDWVFNFPQIGCIITSEYALRV